MQHLLHLKRHRSAGLPVALFFHVPALESYHLFAIDFIKARIK